MLIPFVIRGRLFSELLSVETIGCAQNHIHFIAGRPAFKLYQLQAAVPVKNSLIDMYRSDICAGIHTESSDRLGENGILRLFIGGQVIIRHKITGITGVVTGQVTVQDPISSPDIVANVSPIDQVTRTLKKSLTVDVS